MSCNSSHLSQLEERERERERELESSLTTKKEMEGYDPFCLSWHLWFHGCMNVPCTERARKRDACLCVYGRQVTCNCLYLIHMKAHGSFVVSCAVISAGQSKSLSWSDQKRKRVRWERTFATKRTNNKGKDKLVRAQINTTHREPPKATPRKG